MRPVEKGPDPGPFASYGQALPHLEDRLGDCCSYCERQIETNLAVEHVQPKSLEPGLELRWNNFLLGCTNCNSSKGDTKVAVDDYLWPDLHNTLLAFDYGVRGLIEVASGLSSLDTTRAGALLRLVGLDKDPGNSDPKRRPTERDKRWLRRFQVWDLAEGHRETLRINDTPEVRDLIIQVAVGRGMFSIWFHFFRDDADMRPARRGVPGNRLRRL
jgi:uncharacterized protein (TIGR02646 family)